MKILVTGGAGFIGSHTCRALVKLNHSVVCLDNFNDYYNPLWKEQAIEDLVEHPNFTVIRANIKNESEINSIFEQEKFDSVIHLAARAGVRPSIEQPLLYERVNVSGTAILLESCRKYSVSQFIFASSSSVYGESSHVPFSESDPCNAPVSPYAATKKATEGLAHSYSHLFGIQTIGLRFFTVYGPGGRPDMAPYLFTKAILEQTPIKKFGDGSSRRDYTFIDDIVSGVVACLQLNPHKHSHEIFNLGNTHPVTLNEFISLLEKISDKKMLITQYPTQPGDVSQTYADVSRASKLLGYEPHTSFENGLAKFVEWFRLHRLNK